MAVDRTKVLEAAQKHLSKGAYDKAIVELQKLVKADPSDVRTWLKIGDLHVKLNQRPQAIDTYARVADQYAGQGFFHKAVAVYKQILNLDGTRLDVKLRLAEMHEAMQLTSEAMATYEQVAAEYGRLGDADKALATFGKMVGLDPTNIATRIKYAEALSRAGRNAEAAEAFEAGAELLKKQGRVDDYIKVVERLLFHREDVERSRELAELYLERNDGKRALAKLQVVFKADPKHIPTLELLARAFEQVQQLPKTISVLREIARLHGEQGNVEERGRALKRILTLDPGDPEARRALAQLAAPTTQAPVQRDLAPPPGALIDASRSQKAVTAPPDDEPLEEEAIEDEVLEDEVAYVDEDEPDGDGPQAQTLSADAERSEAEVDEASAEVFIIEEEPVVETTGDEPIAAQTAPADARASLPPDVAREAQIAKLLTEVDVFLRYGLKQKVVEQLRQVLAIDPTHVQARERLKDVLIERGESEAAAQELVALADLFADRPPVALLYLRQARALHPDSYDVLARLDALEPSVAQAPRGTVPPLPTDQSALASADAPVSDAYDADPDSEPVLMLPPDEDEKPTSEVGPVDAVPSTAEPEAPSAMEPVSEPSLPSETSSASEPPSEAPASEPPLPSLGNDDEDTDFLDDRTVAGEPLAFVARPLQPQPESSLVAARASAAVEVAPAPAPAATAPVEGRLEPRPAAPKPTFPGPPRPGAMLPRPAGVKGPQPAVPAPIAAPKPAGITGGFPAPKPAGITGGSAAVKPSLSGGFPAPKSANTSGGLPAAQKPAGTTGGVTKPAGITGGLPAPKPVVGPPATGARPIVAPPRTATPPPSGEAFIDQVPARSPVVPASAAPPQPARASGPDLDAPINPQEFETAPVRPSQVGEDAGRTSLPPGEVEEILDESEFFVAQGLYDEGIAVLRDALAAHPKNRLLIDRIAEIEEMAAKAKAALAEASQPPPVDNSFHLAEKLADELGPSEGAEGSDVLDVEEVFAQFKKGVEKQIGVEDTDTHFDLGIAYKEMGLLNDAIHEFELCIANQQRECMAHTMIGLCQLERGDIPAAVAAFKRGLYAERKTEREEIGLYFELGRAYEAMRDPQEALYYYEKVKKRDPSFLNVQDRIDALTKPQRPKAEPAAATEDLDAAFDELIGKE